MVKETTFKVGGAVDSGATRQRRLHVLISAHEFSPAHGSECAVGWNICSRLARHVDVTVLCAGGPQKRPSDYRDAYKDYVRANGSVPGLDVIFVDQTRFSRVCAKVNTAFTGMADGAGFRLLFYEALDSWHRAAFKTASRLGFQRFDLVHQLTPIGFRSPGYLWRSGLPFAWGPVSGMHCVPASYAELLGNRAFAFELLRSCSTHIQLRSDPRVRSAARSASVLWAVTNADAKALEGLSGCPSRRMIESASPDLLGSAVTYSPSRRLRLCWVGRHDAPKALPLLLRAIASSALRERLSLTVVGKGAETGRWRRTARELLLQNVAWVGWLERNEVMKTIARHDVLVHTSLREGTPHVVLEALAVGRPVVSHDACGMGVAVNDSCGIKVPFVGPQESVQGFRDAIERFILDPDLLSKLSVGALERAGELTWEAKAAEIAAAYGDCLAKARLAERQRKGL